MLALLARCLAKGATKCCDTFTVPRRVQAAGRIHQAKICAAAQLLSIMASIASASRFASSPGFGSTASRSRSPFRGCRASAAKAARRGRLGGAEQTVDRTSGRARTADAAHRARSRRAQINRACDAGAVARRLQPGCRGLSVGARLFSDPRVHRVAVRAVFVAGLHRLRTLCGRGFLRAERVKAAHRRGCPDGMANAMRCAR